MLKRTQKKRKDSESTKVGAEHSGIKMVNI